MVLPAKATDQVRIEGSALAVNPDIKIIAPVREWSMGRDEQLEYCREHGILVRQTKESRTRMTTICGA